MASSPVRLCHISNAKSPSFLSHVTFSVLFNKERANPFVRDKHAHRNIEQTFDRQSSNNKLQTENTGEGSDRLKSGFAPGQTNPRGTICLCSLTQRQCEIFEDMQQLLEFLSVTGPVDDVHERTR